MPLNYWVDVERQIVRSRGTGELSVDDLRTYFSDTRSDPAVTPTMHRLMDLREVTGLLSTDHVRDVAVLSRGLAPATEARMAILASSDLAYGVSMMFKGLVGFGERLVVVRDEPEALGWLTGELPHPDR